MDTDDTGAEIDRDFKETMSLESYSAYMISLNKH